MTPNINSQFSDGMKTPEGKAVLGVQETQIEKANARPRSAFKSLQPTQAHQFKPKDVYRSKNRQNSI